MSIVVKIDPPLRYLVGRNLSTDGRITANNSRNNKSVPIVLALFRRYFYLFQ